MDKQTLIDRLRALAAVRRWRGWSRPFALAPVFLASVSVATAQSSAPQPGSLLLFPEYDNRFGQSWLFTVTNTNEDVVNGRIGVEFVYVQSQTCYEFNRREVLTPGDTLTVLSSLHNPSQTNGYLYVFAVHPVTGTALRFDHLAGHSIAIDGITSFGYSLNPLVYKGVGAEFSGTDHDADGVRDLNGDEYERVADRILIPRFLGQEAQPLVESSLVLVGLSGGSAFSTTIYFQVYNDNEETFSTTYSFFCWRKVRLTEISPIFSNFFLQNFSTDDPLEIVGLASLESGWFWMDGISATSPTSTIVDPAFVGVLLELAGSQSASDLPFGEGLQANGDLLPHDTFPDLD